MSINLLTKHIVCIIYKIFSITALKLYKFLKFYNFVFVFYFTETINNLFNILFKKSLTLDVFNKIN